MKWLIWSSLYNKRVKEGSPSFFFLFKFFIKISLKTLIFQFLNIFIIYWIITFFLIVTIVTEWSWYSIVIKMISFCQLYSTNNTKLSFSLANIWFACHKIATRYPFRWYFTFRAFFYIIFLFQGLKLFFSFIIFLLQLSIVFTSSVLAMNFIALNTNRFFTTNWAVKWFHNFRNSHSIFTCRNWTLKKYFFWIYTKLKIFHHKIFIFIHCYFINYVFYFMNI